MKKVKLPVLDVLLLRKRAIIETIIDQRKNIAQIEHTHHGSPVNVLANLGCGLMPIVISPRSPNLDTHAL